ncbi:S9 family peptidase [Paenibacillus sp. CAU 1782]
MKKILVTALSLCLTAGGIGSVSLAKSETATAAINSGNKELSALVDLGIMPASVINKDKTRVVTRGEAAELLYKAFQLQEPDSMTGFADVSAVAEHAEAIYALKEKNIATGYEGRYHPEKALSNEQAATLLVRSFGWHDNGIQAIYSDQDAISKAHLADALTLRQQFISDSGLFEPKAAINYEQFGIYLYRAMELEYVDENHLPLEYFFQIPENTEYKLSPDGTYLAYLAPWSNRLNLFVQKVGQSEGVRITDVTERNISTFIWGNNTTLIYPMDNGGDENDHLYRIGIDGEGNKDLTPYPGTKASILSQLSQNELLIQLNQRDSSLFDVYKLNIKTGELTLTAQNPGNITSWLADHNGVVRVAHYTGEDASKVLYRASDKEQFQTLMTIESGDVFQPVLFTADNKQLYALTNVGKDKTELVAYDPISKKVTEKLYSDPEIDVSSVLLSNNKIMAAVYERDKLQYYFFDKQLMQLQTTLQEKMAGKSISIRDFSQDENKLLFTSYSDVSPGSYYFYDRTTDTIEKIADSASWINESWLSRTKPIAYTARDGLTINGYLTIPNNTEAKDLPVIVYPHGGPWLRDSWGYSPVIQFIANRGYAVLQMNYRGSTGYGKAFLQAGKKQWGRAMQDDITDGVNWLINEGIADPERIAICGISYGGYAALAGLAFTPDLYAAGVSFVGPSNLITLLNSIPAYWRSEQQMFFEHVGNPAVDEEELKEISPLFHVDKIKAPLFVAQGANDPRVNIAESNQIVEALRKRGIDVPYMVKENEGHGFYNVENQIDFYKTLEKFLHEHLK